MMINCNFDSVLERYREFRNKHYDVVSELNQFKKEIRFIKQFGELSDIQVIDMLYQSEKDIPDIAEILDISECEVYFLLCEYCGKEVNAHGELVK